MEAFRRNAWLSASVLFAIACSDPMPTTGSLRVEVSGLPVGSSALVRVLGPDSFERAVPSTITLGDLAPGTYIVRRDTVNVASTRYATGKFADTLEVDRGRTTAAQAAYAIASGSIELLATGLPDGVVGLAYLTSATTTRAMTIPGSSSGIPPGTYNLRVDTAVTSEGDRYGPLVREQSVELPASLTPVQTTTEFALASATLAVIVDGLPGGTTADAVSIIGPDDFVAHTAASRTFHGLAPGTYTIAAANVNGACPQILTASSTPEPLVDTRTLGPTEVESITLTYTAIDAPASWLDLRITNAYMVQVVQNADGSVPMVEGKAALLRVFGTANQCNSATPQVKITLDDGSTYVLDAPEASVPIAAEEGTLNASWNLELPASALHEGLSFAAEIDPGQTVTEVDETDNRFPEAGTQAVAVRQIAALPLRLIPVVNGTLTGDIGAGRLDTFMALPNKLYPVPDFDVEIGDPYTFGGGTLLPTDANGAWLSLLNAIQAKQIAEGTGRLYYGVVKLGYTSNGIVGVSFVPSRAAVGWDLLPSASNTLAHEMGHMLGRLHSPCGGPSQVDPQYPATGSYVGGKTGVFGYDAAARAVVPDLYFDVMGYCEPRWISDYTYRGMLEYLSDAAFNQSRAAVHASTGAAAPALLVWGRIVNGHPVLEPAFEISAPAALPRHAGPYRISGSDAGGERLFDFSFAADAVADLPGDQRSFAFTIPLSMLRGRTVASLRLDAAGRAATSVPAADVASEPAITSTRFGAGAVRLRWDATKFPVVMVRDGTSGAVLSFARGGDAIIATRAAEVELNLSNRVRSARRLVRPR